MKDIWGPDVLKGSGSAKGKDRVAGELRGFLLRGSEAVKTICETAGRLEKTIIGQADRSGKRTIWASCSGLALNPVSFPQAWLSNSIGNYYLRNFAVAESSARRGLQVDTEHRVAKLEYLLGVILMKKPDYLEATQHLRAFQTLTNKPTEVAEAQKQLDEIARLTAAANLHTDEKQ